MKKVSWFLLFAFLLSLTSIQAQENRDFSFDMLAISGIGYGSLDNSSDPDYAFRTNYFEMLLNFDFGKLIGFSTGFGTSRLSGNGGNFSTKFSHSRTTLKIPLLLSTVRPISKHFDFYANAGIFWKHIIRDEYRYTNSTLEDVYKGSTIGAQTEIGVFLNIKIPQEFDEFRGTRLGLVLSAQTIPDIDGIKNVNNPNPNNTQRIGSIYTLCIVGFQVF